MVTMASLMNASYVSGGRDVERDGGVDCWGFVVSYYHLLGIDLPTWDGVVDGDEKNSLFDTERGKWSGHKSPQANDVVLFELPNNEWHCGIVLPDLVSFAHCRRPKAMVERLDRFIWAKTRRGFYSWEK